jgi:hypothetical protein
MLKQVKILGNPLFNHQDIFTPRLLYFAVIVKKLSAVTVGLAIMHFAPNVLIILS